MSNKFKFLLVLVLISCSTLLLSGCDVPIIHPKGIIALQERNLIGIALGLMLIIVIPTFILTFVIALRYRASNTKATYDPNFTHNTLLELICWGVPCIIIAILGTITWTSSHELDPYKPLDSDIEPVTIQVVALDWKWLFIYPKQKIATVNFV
ncbi:MAG: cytochrome ubiquinol oxidase subunit II, partial [Burkholderiales bacterium]|nr:cytochrome ubiquinol oxidase subunit II [Burkholderiales bacterium]